ncbi:MAG: ATP-grasp domain-containing protein [Coxiellaceae bacterium]|nr:ATP-grasp domain-containing protein [Coxiellaceae bacterium]
MTRPIIIEPLSSGGALAPAFKARGIPVIAVKLKASPWRGFGSTLQTSDFLAVIPEQPGLVDILKKYNPIAVIPGIEDAVPLTEQLAAELAPHYANNPDKLQHRFHKALMQQALQQAGVPVLKTLNTCSENEVHDWITQHDLQDLPLIIKPPTSAGSDKVFHIPAQGCWQQAFHRVLNEPAVTTGINSSSVVVQEQAIGPEFAVGTVSANGEHYVAHLIKYNKLTVGHRKTVFDHVELVAYDETIHKPLIDYTKKSLDALGIRWGAAHSEVIVTAQGPRLIEVGARMCGGPTVEAARAATGSSQADKWAEIFANGDVISKQYVVNKTVVPVFLKSPASGRMINAEVFDEVATLPTLLNAYIWYENNDCVVQTVDYLSAIGIVVLAGDRETVFDDYKKIRQMESNLEVCTL